MTWIIDRFLIWWLHYGRYAWSRFHRRFFEQKYLPVFLPPVNSPEEVEAVLKQVHWTPDRPGILWDCISYPQTTWANKKDDCDGFASLAAELLKRLGKDYHPVMLTVLVRPISRSHTVCVFKLEGKLCFFSNYTLIREGVISYSEVAKNITGNQKGLVCWDVRDPFNFRLIEFYVA